MCGMSTAVSTFIDPGKNKGVAQCSRCSTVDSVNSNVVNCKQKEFELTQKFELCKPL